MIKTRRKQYRFPFEPIEHALAGSDHWSRQHGGYDCLDGVMNSYIAERTGINRGQIIRYKREGLTVDAADRIAIRLGFHPAELWPDFHREDLLCPA